MTVTHEAHQPGGEQHAHRDENWNDEDFVAAWLERQQTRPDRPRQFQIIRALIPKTPDQEFPYLLTTGRLMGHYQSGTQTRRVPELADAQPEPFVEMHPDAAHDIGIGNKGLVRLTSRRGQMTLRARLTPDIRLDTLFVPFHWGGADAANILTNTALDPIARIPEFKVCAVRLEAPRGVT